RAVLDRAEAEREWNPRQRLRLQVTRLNAGGWSDDAASAEARAKSRELLPLAEQLNDPWAEASLLLTAAAYYPLSYGTSIEEALPLLDRGLAVVQGHPELLGLQLQLQLLRVA